MNDDDILAQLDFTLELSYDVFRTEEGKWAFCCLSCQIYREFNWPDHAKNYMKGHGGWIHRSRVVE